MFRHFAIHFLGARCPHRFDNMWDLSVSGSEDPTCLKAQRIGVLLGRHDGTTTTRCPGASPRLGGWPKLLRERTQMKTPAQTLEGQVLIRGTQTRAHTQTHTTHTLPMCWHPLQPTTYSVTERAALCEGKTSLNPPNQSTTDMFLCEAPGVHSRGADMRKSEAMIPKSQIEQGRAMCGAGTARCEGLLGAAPTTRELDL